MSPHDPARCGDRSPGLAGTGAVCAPANWKIAKMIWTRNSPAWTFDDTP